MQKIETVGKTYMAACGINYKTSFSVLNAINLAFDMVSFIKTIK